MKDGRLKQFEAWGRPLDGKFEKIKKKKWMLSCWKYSLHHFSLIQPLKPEPIKEISSNCGSI